jgi:hypothetical protein
MATPAVIKTLEDTKVRLEKSLSYYQGRDWNNPGAQFICEQLDLIEAALIEIKTKDGE